MATKSPKKVIDEIETGMRIYAKVSEPSITKFAISAVTQAFGEVLADCAIGEETIKTSYGTFKPVVRKGRRMRPRGGKVITFPPYKTIVFKPSKRLRDTINNQPTYKNLSADINVTIGKDTDPTPDINPEIK